MDNPPERTISGNEAQMASPSYRLASIDTEFLLSEPLRWVRLLVE